MTTGSAVGEPTSAGWSSSRRVACLGAAVLVWWGLLSGCTARTAGTAAPTTRATAGLPATLPPGRWVELSRIPGTTVDITTNGRHAFLVTCAQAGVQWGPDYDVAVVSDADPVPMADGTPTDIPCPAGPVVGYSPGWTVTSSTTDPATHRRQVSCTDPVVDPRGLVITPADQSGTYAPGSPCPNGT